MKLDLTLYDHAQNTIQYMIASNTTKPPRELVSSLCGATQIPILGIHIMYCHYTGYTPELIESMRSLQEFYKYTTIVGLDKYPNDNIPEFIKCLSSE